MRVLMPNGEMEKRYKIDENNLKKANLSRFMSK
jgi:hypothetical protein